MLRLLRLLGFRRIAAERELAILRRQLADVRAQLEAEQRTVVVKQHEIDQLAGIIARDRQRVAAETAIESVKIAAAQGAQHGRAGAGATGR